MFSMYLEILYVNIKYYALKYGFKLVESHMYLETSREG